VHDVLSDYRDFLSWPTAGWLGIGGGAALAAHAADQPLHDEIVEEGTTILPGALFYGSEVFQLPMSAGVWMAGWAGGSPRVADTGRDLLRTHIAVVSWTNAIKWSARRTRPNGDPRGFPSGHSAASFATAVVLQEHYGWKLGVPAFALAIYTGTSRVTADEHWLSDIVFGAALGMVCARTVTMHLRDHSIAVSPVAVRRGGGFIVVVRSSL
jgi:membrane-associated phospholipid phosphatase